MEIPEKLRNAAHGEVAPDLTAWRRLADGMDLTEVDPDLLDLVFCLDRELRATAVLAGLSRRRGVTYPVNDVEDLADALGDARLELGEHEQVEVRVRRAPSEGHVGRTGQGLTLSTARNMRNCMREIGLLE